ncbi:11174_t:CDS:2 [Cetraspora pellucida]|uniref:11174_t:CDS:1 n=1 Tax=Cetraspora pellucida TaxID=1433469 RepID=A0ACA9L0U4_9GLOM|nr:11174_t:CDS:2 [Cetraspora pellucida]
MPHISKRQQQINLLPRKRGRFVSQEEAYKATNVQNKQEEGTKENNILFNATLNNMLINANNISLNEVKVSNNILLDASVEVPSNTLLEALAEASSYTSVLQPSPRTIQNSLPPIDTTTILRIRLEKVNQ